MNEPSFIELRSRKLFSLQELCLLYLVGRLDKYTPNTLSLLPAHLRHQLLSRLPAYDLKTLEDTPVVSGLDVSTYWQALYDYFKEKIAPECKYCRCYQCSEFESNSVDQNQAPKESVMRLAESHVVQEIISLVQDRTHVVRVYPFCMRASSHVHRLYSSHGLLLAFPVHFIDTASEKKGSTSLKSPATLKHAELSYFDSEQRLVIPSRLTSLVVPWERESTDCVISLMKILVDHFNYRSRYLPLYEPVYTIFGADSNKWKIIEEFMSRVETIRCVSGGRSCGSPSIDGWSNILQGNFSAKDAMSRLTVLDLNNWDYKSFDLSMELLSPYLGCPTESLPMPTYKALKEIKIHLLWDGENSTSGEHPLYKFAAIVDSQEQLCELYLYGNFMATPQSDAVMMAVVRLMKKESMKSVTLRGHSRQSQLYTASLSELISSYLFTPTSHEQVLQLSNIVGTVEEGKKTIDPPIEEFAATVDGQCMKSLSLVIEQIPTIFSKNLPPVTLKAIELDIGGPEEKHSLLPNLSASSLTLTLKETGDLVPETHTRFVVGATVRGLILNSQITHLSVSSHTLVLPDPYLDSLGQLIAQHAEQFHTLKSIKIRNGMDAEQSRVSDSLCESLVSLSQVVPLELTLENMLEHLKRIKKVWKKNKCAQRFSRLVHIPSLYSRNIDGDNKKAAFLMSDIADSASTDKS